MLISFNRILGYEISDQGKRIGVCSDFVLNGNSWDLLSVVIGNDETVGTIRSEQYPTAGLRKPDFDQNVIRTNGKYNAVDHPIAKASLASGTLDIPVICDLSKVATVSDLIIELPEWRVSHVVISQSTLNPFSGELLMEIDSAEFVNLVPNSAYFKISKPAFDNLEKFAPDALLTPDNRFILNEMYGFGTPYERLAAKIRSIF